MSDKNCVFKYIVVKPTEPYQCLVQIEKENDAFTMHLIVEFNGLKDFNFEIPKDRFIELLKIVSPVKNWNIDTNIANRSKTDDVWFISFSNNDDTVKASGYNLYPDDFNRINCEIMKWVHNSIKKDYISTLFERLEKAKNTKNKSSKSVFSYSYSDVLSNCVESIKVKEENDKFHLTAYSSDCKFPCCYFDIEQEDIDKLCNIMQPVTEWDENYVPNHEVIDGSWWNIMIKYKAFNISIEGHVSYPNNFEDVLSKLENWAFEMSKKYDFI